MKNEDIFQWRVTTNGRQFRVERRKVRTLFFSTGVYWGPWEALNRAGSISPFVPIHDYDKWEWAENAMKDFSNERPWTPPPCQPVK